MHLTPQHTEHGIVTLAGQRLIGPVADIAHRAADDHLFGQAFQRRPAARQQMAQEDLAQFLEG
jgi:hypothetical protein